MSDTPETDNAAFAACEVHEDCGVVYAEFAEQLERERDVAREVVRNLSVALTATMRSGLLCLVRDLQDTIARLRDEINFTIRLSRTWEDDVKKISADRDYWKAEAERWRAIK